MFFSKKTKTIPPAPKATAERSKAEPYDFHVMPMKFHKYLSARRQLRWGRLLLILLSILVLGAAIFAGAYYLQKALQTKPQANINANQPLNTEPNINSENLNQENANENSNANLNDNLNADNANENGNENLNDNLNANNANVNENVNENANANVNEAPEALPYSSSLDSDNDGLTDIEEDLYATEKRKPDTDSDGFLDGQEVQGGYNPKAAGSATLEMSGLVNKYINPLFGYEILYPQNWLSRSMDQSLRDVILQSATEEYAQILVEDNADKSDLVKWYLAQSPGADLNLLSKETTKNGYEALVSPDKLTYYIIDSASPELVYIVSYNIGNKSKINFLTTFKMMLNSLKLKSVIPSE